jgi:hypothetical protein
MGRPETRARSQNVARSGKVEFLNGPDRATINLRFRYERGQVVNHELAGFYRHARSGQTFALMVHETQGPYWSFENQTLLSNDHVDGSVSRASVGNYIDQFDGLVKEAAVNQPRFEAGKFGGGLLVESASTNEIINNGSFSAFATFNSELTADGATFCPDIRGNNAAWHLSSNTITGVGGIWHTSSISATASSTWVASFWAKALTKPVTLQAFIRSSASGNTRQDEYFAVSTEWRRYQYHTLNSLFAGGNVWLYYQFLNATLNQDVLIQNPQFELDRTVASSDIFTTGSAQSRSVETVTLPIDKDDINERKGAVCFWIKPRFHHNDGAERWIMQIETSTGKDFLRVVKNAAGNFEVSMRYYDDSGNGAQVAPTGDFLDPDTWTHIAIVWDQDAAAVMSLYVDGVLKQATSTPGFQGVCEPTQILLGRSSAGGSFLIDDLDLKKYAMTAANVSTYYASGKGRGRGRNIYRELWLTNPNYAPELRPGEPMYEVELPCAEYL